MTNKQISNKQTEITGNKEIHLHVNTTVHHLKATTR